MNSTFPRRRFLVTTAAMGGLTLVGEGRIVCGEDASNGGNEGAKAPIVDPRDFGAVGDGTTLATTAIQKAIDHVAEQGGGTVRISEGKWLSGTIYLANGVTLTLDAEATLLGSRKIDDYGAPRTVIRPDGTKEEVRIRAMIAGVGLRHVAIRGEGTIDGQGDAFRYRDRPRPMCIRMTDCEDVLIEGVRMRASGSWMQHYRTCRRLVVRGIDVFNHVAYNNDGLDVDSCSDVCISDCRIHSDDDAIVLKSLSQEPCENITIANCKVSSHCNALKLGTESGGGFKNIRIADCTVRSPEGTEVTFGRQRGLAGIALELVDGGQLENVDVGNVDIDGVSVAVFIRLGNRARIYGKGETPGVGTLRNVALHNIKAAHTSDIGCSITGLPGHNVENVVLRNIAVAFDGGGERKAVDREIPERADSYPESIMFGMLPAYGFFCRHVRNLVFENITLSLHKADFRHAMVFDDVANLQVDKFRADSPKGAAPLLRLDHVQQALIRHSHVPETAEAFVAVTSPDTRAVLLSGNDVPAGIPAVVCGDGVPEDAVTVR